MNVQQLSMLGLEAVVMIAILLALFRARSVLGLTPLYVVTGGFQYLEATVSLKVEVLPEIFVRPASAVFFTATLLTVLIIYIKEDTLEARKLVYGVVLANAALSLASLMLGWQVTLPGADGTQSHDDFLSSAFIAAGGTSLLFIDVLGIILTYEYISRFTRHLCYRMFFSLLVIVAFDTVLFSLLVSSASPSLLRLILTGFVAKAVVCAFYSTVCWAYLRFVEPETVTTGSGDVADVFQTLTYRQKYEAARLRMVRDALTGLYNRGYFDEVFPQMLAHADREHEPLSLVVIDTDNFKSINDQFSHLEGDVALKLIADTLQSHARAADVPCRLGGDEFVVLISAGDAAAARTYAERFRASLHERCQTADPPYPWGYVTTTIGVATYPDDATVPQELMRVADARLYVGKRGGRDTVIAAPAPDAPATATVPTMAASSTQRAERG